MAEEQIDPEKYRLQVEAVIRSHLPFMLSVSQRIGNAITEGASEDTLRLINVPVNAGLFGALTALAASAYPQEKTDEPA